AAAPRAPSRATCGLTPTPLPPGFGKKERHNRHSSFWVQGMPVLNIFKIVLAFATASLIVGIGTVAGLFWHFSHGLPDHKTLADYQPATVSRLYAADGRLLAEYAKEKRVFLPVAALPQRLLHAL